MEREELVGYLRGTADPALTPMQSILAQTESIGDPALPTADEVAILEWVGVAFEEWEKQFPLEPELAADLRRIKPLAAALAIIDPDFLVPGEHPLHRILDDLQLGAVGWQAKLGRAGQAVENQLRSTIDTALTWFDSDDVDLAGLSEKVGSTTEKDLARAGRLAQRTIEAEQGRIRTAEAKRDAAGMINAALQLFPVTPALAKFLKGPWYASAQLVLLKFGADSDQWSQMSATTSTLLDSLQPDTGEDATRRQQLFDVVTQLPKDLRRWLLSLQHDSNAVGDALGIVEFAHLQILRKRPLELEHTTPIPLADEIRADSAADTVQSLQAGQWFSVDMGSGDLIRARLVLKIDSAGQLLFANLAGIKVLQQSFDEFAGLIDSGRVTRLDCGASFSRSLTHAAGIATTDELEAILGTDILLARQRQQEERQRMEQEQPQQEWDAAQGLQPLQGGQSPGAAEGPAAIDLPMGTWLGFHDGDTPLLAKLAVHDRENNHYIFVNRSGIKLRQLSEEELATLMHRGLVDILETRSNFRDEISRVKSSSEE